jgi:hypothetical protein
VNKLAPLSPLMTWADCTWADCGSASSSDVPRPRAE